MSRSLKYDNSHTVLGRRRILSKLRWARDELCGNGDPVITTRRDFLAEAASAAGAALPDDHFHRGSLDHGHDRSAPGNEK